MNIPSFLSREKTGLFFEVFGICFFLLLFWLPFGFFLGGDAYFLGKYDASLEVIFPYGGLGILFVFLGKFLSGTSQKLLQKQILFILFFLAVFGISANFSLKPEVSILFLILWTIGFFSASFGNSFFIEKPWQQKVFLLGITLGYFFTKIVPEWDISGELLGIGALILSIFLSFSYAFRGRRFMILFLFWVIFESQNLGIILFTIFLWMCASIWLPKYRKIERERSIVSPLILLVGLTIYGFYQQVFDTSYSRVFLPIFEQGLSFIFGFGEGQFLIALQNFSSVFLIPEKMQIPQWGIITFFFEKGASGILLILFLCANAVAFQGRNKMFPAFLFFCFWMIVPDFLSSENGILLSLVFLFAKK